MKILILTLTVVVIEFPSTLSAESTHSLEKILKNYDKNVRPFLKEGKPVTVRIQIYIMQLSNFRTDDFTYKIDYFLRQWWNDPRLANSPQETVKQNKEGLAYEENDETVYDHDVDIWLPHLTVMNSIEDKKVRKRETKLVIESDGDVYRSERRKAM